MEFTVDNEVFESTSAFSQKSDVINGGSQSIRDSSSSKVEGVFSDSGLNFDGDVVDFVVFRGVIKDSSSVPSDVISGQKENLRVRVELWAWLCEQRETHWSATIRRAMTTACFI